MYRLGPGFDNSVDFNNKLKVLPIYNVIGTIHGREEPDRYVLIGNHGDSWVYGAIDAFTGTAVTTEIARVLVEMKNSGWGPRRTRKVKKRKIEFFKKNVQMLQLFIEGNQWPCYLKSLN